MVVYPLTLVSLRTPRTEVLGLLCSSRVKLPCETGLPEWPIPLLISWNRSHSESMCITNAGSKAFLGQLPGTDGAPLYPLSYIAINLAFNVSVLNLLRTTGALVATLSLSALIPLTIVAFTFEWPLIGAAASLSWNFVIGTVLLLCGLIAYNWESLTKRKDA